MIENCNIVEETPELKIIPLFDVLQDHIYYVIANVKKFILLILTLKGNLLCVLHLSVTSQFLVMRFYRHLLLGNGVMKEEIT